MTAETPEAPLRALNEQVFSIEDLSRLKTIDRCLAHAEKKGIPATRSLSSEQVRFLRYLVEQLAVVLARRAPERPAVPRGPETTSRPLRPNRFDCPDCGQEVGVDEDGCCRTCGVDAIVVKNGHQLSAPATIRPEEP